MFCKRPKFGQVCVCKMMIYQIRPYTFEFLSAIQPFYEIMAISNIEFTELKFIVEHIENILNEPIIKNNKKINDKMALYQEKI